METLLPGETLGSGGTSGTHLATIALLALGALGAGVTFLALLTSKTLGTRVALCTGRPGLALGARGSGLTLCARGAGVAVFALFALGTLGPDLASRTGRTLRAFIALGSSGTLRTGRSDRARGSLCAERGGSRHGSEEENQDRPGDDRSITLHEYLHREPT
ncbi:MAG TPA: hypothetical protein VFO17_09660 [Acidimicrobiia bacterium]|nr:hypothetical protein [Acidimicrobiia bacterium]